MANQRGRGRSSAMVLGRVLFGNDRSWIWVGLIAMALWIAIFAIGVMVPSAAYVRFFQQIVPVSSAGGETKSYVQPREGIGRELERSRAGATGPTSSSQLQDTSTLILSSAENDMHVAANGEINESKDALLGKIVIGFLSYTPSNTLLLTCAAGLIGGCYSRQVYRSARIALEEGNTQVLDDDLPYLRENPFTSMFRAFVVFSLVMSGIFLATADVFQRPSQEQYLKLAGLLTATGFAAGYNPRLFGQLLSTLPGGVKKEKTALAPGTTITKSADVMIAHREETIETTGALQADDNSSKSGNV